MARAGDVIKHPVTRERIEFLDTARGTGGASLRMDLLVGNRGFAAAEHIHKEQDERFEILSGRFRYRLGGVEREAEAGEVVEIPKGVRHVWWNAGEEDLRTIIAFRPALRSEEFFESYFAPGKDGRTDPKTDMPNLLQTAVLLREFKDEIHLAKQPLFVQRIVFGTLALVGRLFGYGARYPYAARGITDRQVTKRSHWERGRTAPPPTKEELETTFDPMFRGRRRPKPRGSSYVPEVR